MSPGDADKLKTTREKKCPKCGSKNVMSVGSHDAGATGRPPVSSRHDFLCQDCKAHFVYLVPSA